MDSRDRLGYHVMIIKNRVADRIDVYLTYRRPNNIEALALPVKFIFQDKEEGDRIEPTFSLPASYLPLIAEELDRLDVKTDKDAMIQGTLEATRFHLDDLRQLLDLIPTKIQVKDEKE